MLVLLVLGLFTPLALGGGDVDICEGFPCPPGEFCIPFTFSTNNPQCVPFDVCEGVDCPNGEICKPLEVQCVVAPCFPVPDCSPGDKPGQCPSTEGMFGICVEECGSDADCDGDSKCCSNGCGHVCTGPQGFCEETPAQDETAIEMCNFLLDSGSPFYDCTKMFSLDDIKYLFMTCTNVYCEKGVDGLCDFVTLFLNVCQNKFNVAIEEKLDVCIPLCTEHPHRDPAAIEACSFIIDSNSLFAECSEEFSLDEIKDIFQKCTEIYCEEGIPGVCEFAERLIYRCGDEHEVIVTGVPEICRCIGNPADDENAIEACSFLLDRDSPFYDCTQLIDIDTIKAKFQLCTEIYCEKDMPGVCEFAENFKEKCEIMGAAVDGMPEGCPKPRRDLCEEDPTKDEAAIEACQFLIETGTKFSECTYQIDLDIIKANLTDCVFAYCEHGQEGVCDIIIHLISICETKYDVTIEIPDECKDTFCVMHPSRDPTAISMCDFVIDSNSPFYDCTQHFDIIRIKELLKKCTEYYCESGVPGVCAFADYLIKICEEENGPLPGDIPPICQAPPTPSTTTPMVCRAPFSSDENAIEACSFLFDSDDDFYECSQLFDLGLVKDWFLKCTEIYCIDGMDGLCSYAGIIIEKCARDKGVDSSLPPVCVP